MKNQITKIEPETMDDMPKYEAFKVVADGYRETFDSEQMAKRAFGIIKKEIKDDGDGYVELYFRKTEDAEWKLLQEFVLESEDEDEDEDDQDEDDQDEDDE
jgi:hypothetical protein